jgi:hypothetical protein
MMARADDPAVERKQRVQIDDTGARESRDEGMPRVPEAV